MLSLTGRLSLQEKNPRKNRKGSEAAISLYYSVIVVMITVCIITIYSECNFILDKNNNNNIF